MPKKSARELETARAWARKNLYGWSDQEARETPPLTASQAARRANTPDHPWNRDAERRNRNRRK